MTSDAGADVEHRAWMLPAAAGLAALEVVLLGAVLVLRGTRSAPFLILCLAVKIPFCALLMRRQAGAWMALVLWEAAGLFAALFAPRVPVVLRLLEAAVAASVLVLLGASLSLIPRARLELPDR